MKKYRMGLVGFAHMHVLDQIKPFINMGDRVEWIGCADVKPLVEPLNTTEPSTRAVNMSRCIEQCGIKNVYEDYHDLLAQKPDIILVNCENAFHGKVISEIVSLGIHVIVEKPMAYCMEDAMAIARASKIGGGSVITNWPTAWQSVFRLLKQLVDEGVIGKIYNFKYRNGDSFGPMSYGQVMTDAELASEWWHQAAAGGGSMLDYCCYGSMLSAWFINEKPSSAYGLKANFGHKFGDAEDYASIVVKYPEAVAQLEGTWNTYVSGVHPGPIIWGDKGALVVDNGHYVDMKVMLFTERYSTTPSKVWSAADYPLPEGRADLAEEVFHHLETGEPLFDMLQFDLNMVASQILDAGRRSAISGCEERIRTPDWTIG